MLLDRWFNLDGALPESQILLRVILKVVAVPVYLLTLGRDDDSSGTLVFPPL